jgi:hypothetical protein
MPAQGLDRRRENQIMSLIEVPVSYGELIDKITILEIKSERIADPQKLLNIRRELELLTQTWGKSSAAQQDIVDARTRLKQINEKLWDIEDQIRLQEAAGKFQEQFIQLARDVYYTNDIRARIKKEINLMLGSELVEEKSYQDYS